MDVKQGLVSARNQLIAARIHTENIRVTFENKLAHMNRVIDWTKEFEEEELVLSNNKVK